MGTIGRNLENYSKEELEKLLVVAESQVVDAMLTLDDRIKEREDLLREYGKRNVQGV